MREGASNDDGPARSLSTTMPGPDAGVSGDWRGRGLCVGEDPELFFPSRGAPGAEARDVCAACAVRSDCLMFATAADEFGIWGGLDQVQRRNLKRRWQRRQVGVARAGDSRSS
jgi:WhiB family redox-sensing transcriptional regulator